MHHDVRRGTFPIYIAYNVTRQLVDPLTLSVGTLLCLPSVSLDSIKPNTQQRRAGTIHHVAHTDPLEPFSLR